MGKRMKGSWLENDRSQDDFLEARFCNIAAAVIGAAVVSSAMAPDAPDAPDMTATNNASAAQSQLARDQYDDYKRDFAPRILRGMDDARDAGFRQEQRSNDAQDFQLGLMRKYDDRFWDKQAPLEDSMIREAMDYDTEANRERMAGLAAGDVQQSFGLQRGQDMRGLTRMGVNPNDGAFGARMADGGRAQALAMSSAKNKTRIAAEQIGWAKKGDAAALGRGLPGFSSGASAAAGAWGASGLKAGTTGLDASIAGSGAANGAADTSGRIMGDAGRLAGIGLNASLQQNQITFDAAKGKVAPYQSALGMYAGGATSKYFAAS